MKNILLILLLIFAIDTYAQFEISTVLRPRYEYRNGYKQLRTKDTDAASFVSQRTRLSLAYKKDKLKTKLTLYDLRVWGDQKLKSDNPSVGLFEAWFELALKENWMLKAGRQALKYDNSRLVSPVNWNQAGAAHDAIKLTYKNNGWWLDGVFAYNQSGQNTFGTDYSDMLSNYKSLGIIWASKKIGNFDLATLNIMDAHQKEGTENTDYQRYTSGLVAKLKKNQWGVDARAFGQFGKNQIGQDIAAWYVNLDLNLKASEKTKLTAGFEIMSGNDMSDYDDDKDNAFDIVLGGRHKFNGRIDYFSVPTTTGGAGLINPYVRLGYTMNEKANFLVEYHYFMNQNKFVHNGETMDKFLAHEVDFTYNRQLYKNVQLQFGYSMIFAGKTAEIIKKGDKDLFNHWAFVMITVNPVLFKSE